MATDRLVRQVEFLLEVDRLKGIGRQSYVLGGERKENSAEHSWHVALMAVVLAEHAPETIELVRVVRMLLVHDLVEIDAGDAYFYDEAANEAKPELERAAAERIFGLLPADQATDLRAAWEEFEVCETPEARFAKSMDRLMPLLHNHYTQGRSWLEHGVSREQVVTRFLGDMEHASPAFYQLAVSLIDDAVAKGWLARSG
ncbi:MAG: HD domain-containing protein [Victivallales bacterium]|jgi:putative hydrolases of HD superfamily|nr:HD domain-containing protein [Victivallales bacterium]MBT7300558.1 HD domain-containing protein [Victivallales bacterium]